MGTALYRKYRPSDFSGVIGQPHITATLQNQIAGGRVGHAYLFCGSRGVGKTSLARIFAHAINCTANDAKTARTVKTTAEKVPCGKCETCKSWAAGNNLDITEIDAASNNGVDDARDLREKVKYPPMLGRYKVYIIDEVHMLTGSAFNALLKTLEEPPSHAVFILATTEPHKLPATILSRCMRFDFKLVGMNQLTALLADIFTREGKKYEDEALRAIAAAAEGSVRDALSLADTCLNLTDGILTARQVADVLGGGDSAVMQLLSAIAAQDIAGSLTLVGQLYEDGKSMSVIAKQLAHSARDLMVAKTAPDVLCTTAERLSALTGEAKAHSIESLAAMVHLFSEMDNALRYSVSPRIAMEAAMIRAVKLYSLDLTALDERILRLERRLDSLAAGGFTLSGTGTGGGTSIANATASNATETKSTVIAKSNTESVSAAEPKRGVNTPPTVESDYSDIPPPFEPSFDAPPDTPTYAPTAATPQKSNATAMNNPQSSANSGSNTSNPQLSATQLWGRIITYFRRNSTPALTQAVGRQNPARLTLKRDSLTVAASREDYLIMCDPALQEVLLSALAAEGYNLKVFVEKDALDVDMEKEVSRLYDEVGKDKVKIIK